MRIDNIMLLRFNFNYFDYNHSRLFYYDEFKNLANQKQSFEVPIRYKMSNIGRAIFKKINCSGLIFDIDVQDEYVRGICKDDEIEMFIYPDGLSCFYFQKTKYKWWLPRKKNKEIEKIIISNTPTNNSVIYDAFTNATINPYYMINREWRRVDNQQERQQ